MHTLINADCLDYLNGNSQTWTTCFFDPPDNIGLGYQTYKDKLPDEQYVDLLSTWLHLFVYKAKTVWFSFNAKWSFEVGRIVSGMLGRTRGLEAKPCVQTFTFGQHCHHDLGNNHRPLLRLRWFDAPCGRTRSACRVGGKRTATSGRTRAGGCPATCSISLASLATPSSVGPGTRLSLTRAWSSDA